MFNNTTQSVKINANGNSYLNGGNVGIGTTSPAAKLHVDDSVGGKLRLSNISATADGEKIGGIETGVANGTFFAGINFFRHDANDGEIRFRTKVNNTNTDVMAIVDGNVGIGTDNPAQDLTLYRNSGDTNFLISSNNGASQIFFGDTESDNIGKIDYDHSDDSLNFVVNASERMRVTSTGNVGIGTTSPTRKLNVNGNVGINNQLLLDSANYGEHLVIRRGIYGYDTIVTGTRIDYSPTASTNTFKFLADLQTTGQLNVTGNAVVNGNVGIGTTSPAEKLEVAGSVRVGNMKFEPTNAGRVGFNRNTSNGAIYNSNYAASQINGPSSGADFFEIQSYNSSGVFQGTVAINAGNVGIGTTSPTTTPGIKLDVIGGIGAWAANNTSTLKLFNGRLVGAGRQITNLVSTNGNGSLELYRSDNLLNVLITGSGNSYLNGGNVGIGTTSPGFKLDVAGNARVSSNFYIGNVDAVTTATEVLVRQSDRVRGITPANLINASGGPFLPLAGGTMSGNTNHSDNVKDRYGTGNDFQIWHDGSNTFLSNEGEGHLNIINTGDDRDIIFKTDDGSGATTSYMVIDGSAEQTRFYKDTRHTDGIKANFGDSNDLQIYHSGSHSYIKDTGTGSLYLQTNGSAIYLQDTDGNAMAQFTDGGGSFLFYNGNLKLSTTNTGVTVTGAVTATTFLGDLNGTINTATTAVTKANATNDTTVATTAFVQNLIGTIPAGLVFQGTWNAATNTPTLTSGSGTTGHFYIVSTDGSTNLDGITDWKVGDWAVFVEQGASDQWEKVDNSSVLDGSGTGGSVAGWAGSGTSNTLTNAPITFSGNNTTFAGDISIADKLIHSGDTNTYLSFSGADNIKLVASGKNVLHAHDNGNLYLYGNNGTALTLDGSQNATFAGNIVGDGTLDTQGTITVGNGQVVLGGTGRIQGVDTVSASTDAANKAYVDAHGGGLGPFLPLAGGTLTGTLTVGADASGHDVVFYGNATGEKMIWNHNSSRLQINHDTDDSGLDIFTVSSSTMTQPQLRVGRDQGQYWGVYTDDRNAHLVHRQDETTGIMTTRFDQWDSNTGDTTGEWQWRSGDGSGASMTNALVLTQAGNATFAGDVTIPQYLKHTNDADTYFGFSASNQVLFHVGGSDRLIINSAGNVGIGVTSPSIVGGTAKLTVNVGSGTSSPVSIVNGTTDGMYIRRYAGNGQYQIQTTSGSGNSGNLSLQSYGGNVGVGVVNPSEKLSVDGNILISDTDNNKYFGSLVNLILNADSDGNSGDTARNIIFQNRGSEKMRITSAGRVGIGTTNPGNELEVLGGGSPRISLRTTSETVGEALELGFQVGTSANSSTNSVGIIKSVITQASPSALKGDMVFQTNSGDSVNTKMVIKDSGNVGIGTTSPAAKLDIDDGAVTDVRIRGNQTSDARIGAYNFYNTAASDVVAAISADRDGANDAAALAFDTQIAGGGMTERMRITSTGNVGIGTTSPSKKLDIAGDVKLTNSNSIYWRNAANNADIPLLNLSSNNTFNIGTTSSSVPVQMALHTAGSERMRITSGGNVGIGTTNPGAKLHTIETGASEALRIDGASGGFALVVSGGSSYKTSLKNASVGNTYVSSAAPANGLIVEGSVGIGTTSPSQKLHVKGNILVEDNDSTDIVAQIGNSGDDGWVNLYANGTSTAFIGSNAVSYLNGGNVGIGTTAPDFKLDVAGDIGMDGKLYHNGDHNTYISFTADTQTFRTGGSDRVSINNTGVGIGTTSPSYRLTAYGSSTNSEIVASFGSGNDENEYTAIGLSGFIASNGATKAGLALKRTSLYGTGELHFLNNNTTDNSDMTLSDSKMMIDSSGNVGIGTTSPGSKLEVSSGVGANGDSILTISADTDNSTSSSSPKLLMLQKGGTKTSLIEMDSSDRTHFSNATGYYFSGGNVGIGTTSPGYKLDVDGVVRGDRFFVGTNTAASQWAFHARNNNSTADSGLYFNNNSSEIYLRNSSNVIGARIRSNSTSYFNGGDVGIGIAVPQERLHVSGETHPSIKLSSSSDGNYNVILNCGYRNEALNLSVGGYKVFTTEGFNTPETTHLYSNNSKALSLASNQAATFTSTVTATNFINSSDERLKENIEEVRDNNVEVNWKTFNFKTEKEQKRYGVIAQELEKTNPEFVREDSQGFKSVAYIDLLIAKIAELEARIQKLEK